KAPNSALPAAPPRRSTWAYPCWWTSMSGPWRRPISSRNRLVAGRSQPGTTPQLIVTPASSRPAIAAPSRRAPGPGSSTRTSAVPSAGFHRVRASESDASAASVEPGSAIPVLERHAARPDHVSVVLEQDADRAAGLQELAQRPRHQLVERLLRGMQV